MKKHLLIFIVSALPQISAYSQQYDYQVLHDFLLSPSFPVASLVEGDDGNFYGITPYGGTTTDRDNSPLAGTGAVFKIDPSSGALTLVYAFSGASTAPASPQGFLIKGSDGNFYGTTSAGGSSSLGTVFKITPTGVLTVLHSFTGGAEGSDPLAGLCQGQDGNFYGTTYGGGSGDKGTIFKITPSGVVTTLYSFVGTDGANPYAGVIQGSDGNFYGTTYFGGANNLGTVFVMTASGVLTTLHSFAQTDGQYPRAGLVQGNDGNFYGATTATTVQGSGFYGGMIFRITPLGNLTVIHSLLASEGIDPIGQLIQGSDGNFYGTAFRGGTPIETANGPFFGGTVFEVTPAGTLTVLHSFSGDDGANPLAALVIGSDGNFYGTTRAGGLASSAGTIFRMNPAGAVTTLHSFPSDPNLPRGLIQGSDGSFYGATFSGGAANVGSVFKMDISGNLTRLHSFAGSDGLNPFAGLVQGRDGDFYGGAAAGGSSRSAVSAGYGTLFKTDSSGNFMIVHSFLGGPADGAQPSGALMQAGDGTFYGTTAHGGDSPQTQGNGGTVFKIDTAGNLTLLHSFTGSEGAFPYCPLIQATDGNFYGTASGGGPGIVGTVFKMDSSGNVTALHSFAGGDGANPYAGIVQGSDGNFYGTTYFGGPANLGTVFKMDGSGNLTTLYFFTGSDGANPYSGLVEGSDGNFYGSTYNFNGEGNNQGTIFRITPSGVLTLLHLFTGPDGANPFGTLVFGNDGNLYGTTVYGGRSGVGVAFRLSTRLPVQLTSVVSRKMHGSAGTFDVDLTSGNGIECRSESVGGSHTLVFTFTNPLTNVGGANITNGTGSVVSGSIDSNDPRNYIVNLSGVSNAQIITVNLTGVSDSAGNFSANGISASMGVLLGDVNASRRVDAADVSLVRQQTLQPVTSSNFREDVNVSGRIDAADVSIARQQTLTSLSSFP